MMRSFVKEIDDVQFDLAYESSRPDVVGGDPRECDEGHAATLDHECSSLIVDRHFVRLTWALYYALKPSVRAQILAAIDRHDSAERSEYVADDAAAEQFFGRLA